MAPARLRDKYVSGGKERPEETIDVPPLHPLKTTREQDPIPRLQPSSHRGTAPRPSDKHAHDEHRGNEEEDLCRERRREHDGDLRGKEVQSASLEE